MPAPQRRKRELPVWSALGIEPDDACAALVELANEEVGGDIQLIRNDEDGWAAQNPFWSSPVSRSAFLVEMPVAESIAGS
jgi:hypothetical protein